MIIDCIGCLHGHYPKLDGGDLLIVTGDLTARDTEEEYIDFIWWLTCQEYKKKIFIGGNHDNEIQKRFVKFDINSGIVYLCDSGTEFEGLKIWGSPYIAIFEGMNPKTMAFTEPYGFDTEHWLDEHWQQIPNDTDILITHGPPYGIRDQNYKGESCGSKSLFIAVAQIKPKLHVFSHIHEQGGKETDITWKNGTKFVNCSIMNEKYQPVNSPVRVIL